jgi:hypothetical protein
MMKRLLLIVAFLAVATVDVSAQCAMCRSTLENNLSNGDPGIAAGMNTGILFLLALPYLAAVIIGFLWYKSTKDGGKDVSRRVA